MTTSVGSLRGTDSASDDEHDADEPERPRLLSRHNSDVSLAARALSIEEAQVHRMGQKVKRELLSPTGGRAENGWSTDVDGEWRAEGDAHGETEHLKLLRSKLEELQGEELRSCVVESGWERTADYAIGKARSGEKIDADDLTGEKSEAAKKLLPTDESAVK
jgi:hypothetical protein